MKLDRYKIHDIEIVIDRLSVDNKYKSRLAKSIQTAMKYGDKSMMVMRKRRQRKTFGIFQEH